MKCPFVLVILDGWGYREEKTANAIALARTPCWDQLWKTCPHRLITGSGSCVGLPEGQMGNSEVGHLHMGAGRTVWQDLTRIHLAIDDGSFFANPALNDCIENAQKNGKAIHIAGLLSDGGVHSHESHIHALIHLCARKKADKVYVHAFLDGRDTPPKSASLYLKKLEACCKSQQCGQIASLTGRFYAMDRDKRWDRIEKAFQLLVTGKGEFTAETPDQALEAAYARGETDEFVTPTHIEGSPPLQSGDVFIFMNFRADRARELTAALTQPDFAGFARSCFPDLHVVTLTEYDPAHPLPTAFTDAPLGNLLGEYLAARNLRQLRLAETEKYAHVTFFFNGGLESPFPGEDRILVPSPRVTTYDLAPAMSAEKITECLVQAIQEKKYDFIVCNYANADMVGHTGNLAATCHAIEVLDHCLQRVTKALHEAGGEALITADHGNAELMCDGLTGERHTAHTSLPVPLIYFGRPARTRENLLGTLADIAPTALYLMGLPVPDEMTGQTLFELV